MSSNTRNTSRIEMEDGVAGFELSEPVPPSRDPPLTRQQRRALARERAKQSLRKPGGQPGHEGKTREFAGPEQVSADFDHLAAGCGCGHL